MDEESYRYVEGMWMHKFFKDEAILSAVNYKPREGDIFVVTYPKCGTNWTQFIVYNILTRAAPVTNMGEFRLMSPFIDLTGAASAENPLRNGPVMTHFPYNVLRPVDSAKYIYVARNPYDCAVSYYHFIKGLTPKAVTDVSFEKFLNLYLAGKRVIHACSLESMKAVFSNKPMDMAKLMLKAAPDKSETFAMVKSMTDIKEEMHEGSGFVRKGIVGDWRNYFTAEQVQRTKEWITKKTQGSGVMELWDDCDLP
ncbi:hypothetical protein HPB49_020234 [Dermacentor silvarum]|uniref:Uncharacterized protein n=1 Tax=Dermacentor silvarum TaxID=543639 RepID=A0ACB8CH25_DERSI|nr:hypothetical protein HPB49_020234 [Dermacentor silvarum]